MSELLPCPFCGGEAALRHATTCGYDSYWVECENYCNCGGRVVPVTDVPAIAIAAWNTRTDYHGYEQAAIEAWESIKAWNTRAERTCHIEYIKYGARYDVWRCDACDYEYAESINEESVVQNFCPNCGRKVVSE